MAIARLQCVVLDGPDPRELAEFYGRILGWEISEQRSTDTWVTLLEPNGSGHLAFQYASAYTPPIWPGDQVPQQAHLDLEVDDLDEGERRVLEVGARKHEHQPRPDSFRVYLDPTGHPFCLVRS